MYVNLLTEATCRRSMLRRSVRFWGRIWLAVLVAAGVILLWQYTQLTKELRRIEARVTQVEPLKQACAKVDSLREGISTAKSQYKAILQVLPKDCTIPAFGVIANSFEKTDGRTYLANVSITTKPKVTAKNGAASSSEHESTISLSGVAIDEHSVTVLMEVLRDSKAFTALELRSLSELKLTYGVGNQFQIDCKL